jgi:anti-sigma B factor antagonist
MPDLPEASASSLRLRTLTRENEIFVQCTGNLTSSNAALLRSHVKELLLKTKHVVLDLTDLSRMDSSGLGTIVAVYISARNSGATLEIINLNARIRELFGMTNLLSVFETCGRYGTRLP